MCGILSQEYDGAMTTMRANRVHRFGPPEVIVFEELARPQPGAGELLVRVAAAGVGPWDGWIRAGKSVLPQPLPLTLGADLAGRVEALGPGVTGLAVGDEIYGVTNARFTGAYAQWALAAAAMVAPRPRTLDPVTAAGMPVVAVTAWQMLFDHAAVTAGQTVLVLGGAGSVGGFAVQLAERAGARVVATAATAEAERMRALGASAVIDTRATGLPAAAMGGDVDVVIDCVGGELMHSALALLRRGGVLVSAVEEPDAAAAAQRGVRARFMLVEVRTAVLAELAARVDTGGLAPLRVSEVLPLAAARQAHEMLEGMRPRPRGKLVLRADE
jgi:NADPH:quinone reductase-like Zn-dependent oxidoreductase